MSTVHVIDHPMIQHKLTIMRKKDTVQKISEYYLGRFLSLWDMKSQEIFRLMTLR